MKVRAVDTNHDWTFGLGLQDYKVNERAIGQNIKTRLLSFYRDCFFDSEAGIDWFNLLGYGTRALLLMSIKQTILATENVVGINSVDLQVDERARSFTVSYDVKTIYSRSYKENVAI